MRETKVNRLYYTSHSPINVYFSKNSRDFVVEEVPLYEFSGNGEHLVLKIRKKDMTTWELVQKISEVIGCKVRDIGYAGLKDKDGVTTQYISIYKKYEKKIKNIQSQNIKILETFYHNNKIRIGHLKGNKFYIRFKKVTSVDAKKIENVLKIIETNGLPNYFGYQRFGVEGNNYKIGKEILFGKRFIKSRKKRDFFISAYQSHIFNLWLSKRVEISKLFTSFSTKELESLFIYPKEVIKSIKNQPNFFKMFLGDVLHHYPYGKVFDCIEIDKEVQRFAHKELTITGILPGKKVKQANDIAGIIEKDFISECESVIDKMNGSRRFAWIFPEILSQTYKKEEAWYELSFFLPKGSYATVLVEEILHKSNH